MRRRLLLDHEEIYHSFDLVLYDTSEKLTADAKRWSDDGGRLWEPLVGCCQVRVDPEVKFVGLIRVLDTCLADVAGVLVHEAVHLAWALLYPLSDETEERLALLVEEINTLLMAGYVTMKGTS